jgi:subtilisin family serine protease
MDSDGWGSTLKVFFKDIRIAQTTEIPQEENCMANLTRRVLIGLIFAATAGVSFLVPALAEPQLAVPGKRPAPKAAKPVTNVPDELLVMASKDAEQDEFAEAIQSVHGEVIRTIGEGPLTVYVVKTEKGRMAESERKLAGNENVAMVQRNYTMSAQATSPPRPNDPFFPSQWHLGWATNAYSAWSKSTGNGATIAVLDTGVPVNGVDLAGKVYSGYDAVRQSYGQSPATDHGSLMASTAAAVTNNRINTAAVAPGARIYPVKVCNASGQISEEAILRAIYHVGTQGFRIINLSINSAPPYSLSNRSAHPMFHTYAEWFHNQRNGLLFVAAGNETKWDASPMSPNIMVVNSISPRMDLSSFSNVGNNIWFTAPGENMYCTTASGRVANASGTSLSAPCVAAIASMMLSVRPRLRNTEVEQILTATCRKAMGRNYTPYFGYGLPDALRAVETALAR